MQINIFYDIWMDNGIENFYNILKSIPEGVSANLKNDGLEFKILDKTAFLEYLENRINHKRDTIAFYWDKDKKTGEVRNIKKDWVLIQYGKKVKGKNVLKEKIYSDTKERLKEILDSSSKTGKQTCILCNKPFSKKVDKLKQSIYPFVTKIKSLSGIRKLDYTYNELCPMCYLIGSLQWCDEGIIYRTFPNKGHSIIFLPKSNDLKQLKEFKSKYSIILDNSYRNSNIKTITHKVDEEEGVEYPTGEYNTLLCFFEKFLIKCCFEEEENAWMSFESVKKSSCKDWTCINIPSGQVKNIDTININIAEDILGVMYNLTKEDKLIYQSIIMKLLFLKEHNADWDITNQIREDLSKYFITDDFKGFSHSLLPKKQGKVSFPKDARSILDDFIYEWRLKKMGIRKEDLKNIKSVANLVAETAVKSTSLLYRLDKTRTLSDFWDSLREISRKMILLDEKTKQKIKPSSLDDLIQIITENEDSWQDIRNLLVIYSCMYYSIKTYAHDGGEKQ